MVIRVCAFLLINLVCTFRCSQNMLQFERSAVIRGLCAYSDENGMHF